MLWDMHPYLYLIRLMLELHFEGFLRESFERIHFKTFLKYHDVILQNLSIKILQKSIHKRIFKLPVFFIQRRGNNINYDANI